MRKLLLTGLILVLSALASPCAARSPEPRSIAQVRTEAHELWPDYCSAFHSVGKLGVYVDNNAALAGSFEIQDTTGVCFFGKRDRLNGEYPIGSSVSYLFEGGLWVGGILDGDTLVSVGDRPVHFYHDQWIEYGGIEFRAETFPFGRFVYRTSQDPDLYPDAISQEDILGFTADTAATYYEAMDFQAHRPHKPLHIRVRLDSYAWSFPHSDDFVLFDWTVKNIGTKVIYGLYIGLWMDPDVYFQLIGGPAFGSSSDDLCGLLKTFPAQQGCPGIDTFNLTWSADNDGEPSNGQFVQEAGHRSQTGVTALELLNPRQRESMNYNWWVLNDDPTYDWGPRAQPTAWKPYYPFPTGGLGTPEGDRCRYYQMSNAEIDYDQVYMPKIGVTDPNWMYPPPQLTQLYATGADIQYLMSVGPYTLAPGEEIAFPFAYVGGEGFHKDPNNLARLKTGDVAGYLARVDFSDLVKNARTARWVYDNPGIDTDSDGYAGAFRLCALDSVYRDSQWIVTAAETTWYQGDGVPDWRAAQPPPPPVFWLTPGLNSITIRFNGFRSETTKDIFTNQIDFEGYRIYIGRDEREASLSTLASYDHLNFDKWVFRQVTEDSIAWELDDIPLTLEELRCRYGRQPNPCQDTTFDPLVYTHASPYHHSLFADSFFFFVPHEQNAWQLDQPDGIKKLYPDAPKPPTLIADSIADSLRDSYLTSDGYFKYYEYEFTIENLLPTVPYFVNVTAFDYGAPKADMPALETSKTLGIKHAYPLADQAQTDSTLPPVYIYPNPYYGDGRYAATGFEDRKQNRANPDRNRLIHFVNVPASCVIRVYTLDGDLVRAIKHDYDPSDPNSHHETWDMINRNIQTVVSGLYYWTVEGSDGKVQIGKLVIIR